MARRRNGLPRRDAAQAPCRDAQPAGFRRHQHRRHAQPVWRRPSRPASAAFVFTSTTSVFGDALAPPPGAPAAWVTEDVAPVPKNIYGVTKAAAEDLCQLFHRNQGCPASCSGHRAFSPRRTTTRTCAQAYADENVKAERISPSARRYRGHRERASPGGREAPGDRLSQIHRQRDDAFLPEDCRPARRRASGWCGGAFPTTRPNMRAAAGGCSRASAASMSTSARDGNSGWRPRYDFARVIDQLRQGREPRSPLAQDHRLKGLSRPRYSRRTLSGRGARSVERVSRGRPEPRSTPRRCRRRSRG